MDNDPANRDCAQIAYNLLRTWKRDFEHQESKKSKPGASAPSVQPPEEQKRSKATLSKAPPKAVPAVKAAPPSKPTSKAAPPAAPAKPAPSASTATAPIKAAGSSAAAAPAPAKNVTKATTNTSLSSLLLDTGSSSGPVVKKKKKRLVPSKVDPADTKPSIGASGSKKPRIVPLDLKGDVIVPEDLSKKVATVEAIPVVLSADDLIARQKPRPSQSSAPGNFKVFFFFFFLLFWFTCYFRIQLLPLLLLVPKKSVLR